MAESNSFSNGPGATSQSNGGIEPLLHGWFCCCAYCLTGHS